MIDLAFFRDHAADAAAILDAMSRRASAHAHRPATFRLLPALDESARARVLALNAEAFGREGEVFDRRELQEVLDDTEALFLVLESDGVIEGCCFGYWEYPDQITVDGTDFFLDTAMVAPAWRGRAFVPAMAGLFLLLRLLDVHRVGIAVWDDTAAEPRLARAYRRAGFVAASSCRTSRPCMALDLTDDRARAWRATLGLDAPGG